MPSLTRAGAIAAALAIALVASRVEAQVNVETLRSDFKNKPAFATLAANMTGRLGNVEGVIAGASLFVGLSQDRHVFFAKSQGDYAKFGGKTTVSKSFLHARYNYSFTPWLLGEIFSQLQQDKFQRLDFRYLQGIGPRFSLVENDAIDVWLGSAYMLELEKLAADSMPSPNNVSPAHRWSNYASIALRLSERARLTSVVYVQPRFDAPSDFRVLWDSLLKVDLSDLLALQFGIMLRHDSRPPLEVLRTDLEAKNSLSLSF